MAQHDMDSREQESAAQMAAIPTVTFTMTEDYTAEHGVEAFTVRALNEDEARMVLEDFCGSAAVENIVGAEERRSNEQVVRLTLDVSNLTGRPNNEWMAAMVFNAPSKKACDICANRFRDYVEDEDGNVHCLKDFSIYLINEDIKVAKVHP